MLKEMRGYDTPKIKSMIIQLKSKILENRFKLAQGEVSDTSIFKQTRKIVAQLMTILHERNERLVFNDWKTYIDSQNEDRKSEE